MKEGRCAIAVGMGRQNNGWEKWMIMSKWGSGKIGNFLTFLKIL
jgi:hypothetical protein